MTQKETNWSVKENRDAHAWHLYKDNGGTQDICATLAQRKVGQFHLQKDKDKKTCGSPHKIRIRYKIKGDKEVVVSLKNERGLCGSHTNLDRKVPLKK